MFVDAFILAFVLIVWTVYILFRLFGKRTVEQIERTAHPSGDVFVGGTAKKDRGEIAMTASDGKKQNQYGFVEFGTLPEQFTFRFEMLVDEPELGMPLHAFLWLGLAGDPDKESATSSNAINDGGTRIFIMKTDVFGQRQVLEVFRTIVGIARPSSQEPWDLVERVQYFPKNQWVLVTITGDLRARTFRVTIDESRYSFVVPMRFEGPFRGGPAKAYLGAKTLKGTGIRVRNLGLAV
jgi:hypothetical protein